MNLLYPIGLIILGALCAYIGNQTGLQTGQHRGYDQGWKDCLATVEKFDKRRGGDFPVEEFELPYVPVIDGRLPDPEGSLRWPE